MENVDLVDRNLFKVKKSERGAVELLFFNGESWISLTIKQTGEFLAKSILQNKLGGLRRMNRILSIEGEVPDLHRSIIFAKKLREELPTELEMEEILLQDLSHLAEQMHVGTREAATNIDLNMWEFLCHRQSFCDVFRERLSTML